MRGQFDQSLKMVWESLSDTGVSDNVFVRSHTPALSLFHDETDFANIISTRPEDSGYVADELQRVVGESTTGMSLFKLRYLKTCRLLYVKEIQKGLKHLIDQKWADDDMLAWKAQMRRRCAELAELGFKKFEKHDAMIPFFGEEVKIQVECAEDEAEFHLWGLVKSVGLNNGQLPAKPWERCLFSEGCFEHLPRFDHVPQAMLAKIKAARDAAEDFLRHAGSDGDDASLQKMCEVLIGKSKQLLKLDRTMIVDLAFIEHKARDLLQHTVEQRTLSCFPSETHSLTLMECAKRLVEFQSSYAFKACNSTVQKDMGGQLSPW